MKPQNTQLDPGLYLVATPIGNARDITLRALDVLASADVIAAEDTRTTRKLMDIHGIALNGRKLIPYHDHSGDAARAGIVKLIAAGKSVAYASEAGSPLIADPGYALAREMSDGGYYVTALPGASATLAALSLSGLPTDRFLFAGFPPAAKGARATWLAELLPLPTTLVIFESAKRIQKLLAELCSSGAEMRQAAVCRELTKKFEEVKRGTVAELAEMLTEKPIKGEVVIVLDRPGDVQDEGAMEDLLTKAMEDMSMKDAVNAVAQALGLPRRKVYQAALELGRQE
ncbi:16S rRNA (cytidine1402-2'-O)-methyltransferase [Aliiroseovarius sediminilitoris]|uniref:Ribosomal RNA small subunit methyltransferase I n=1 Tax=Aliiroseovarius sediminilitoris TaxID=1173584 RepID=A0A1I0QQU4_9RHOB|nr:16S rRNA (cytidine(1402)-2'-O)-methyltransferase [Aliiroseovarius sediminilitoris]SEW29695.1 16S rRNA (cytidine1402-2'-O)-methyltransferase [Aliiroseovarius sediminilitoris]